MKKSCVIALGAGGAKGISHIGVLEVIEKNNIEITYIAGSSIGAIIGALYASGVSLDKMKEIAFNIDISTLWSLFDFNFPFKGGIIKGKLIEDFLDSILPVKRFEQLEVEFSCTATDLESGKLIIFNKGDLIPAIRASISIPGFFVPYQYKGHILIDGGIVANVPVELLPESELKIGVLVQEFKKIRKISNYKKKLEEKIKSYLNKNFSDIVTLFNKKHKSKKINYLNILSSTFNIIGTNQEFVSIKKKVDILVKPDVSTIPLLAFYKGYESYIKGVEAAEKVLT